MELQLGLALPTTPPIPIKMFDLNNSYASNLPCGVDINNIDSSSSSSSSSNRGGGGCSRKRRFDNYDYDEKNEIQNRAVLKTLPLLLWGCNQPNEEEDDDHDDEDEEDNSASAIFKNDGEGLIGWPPVKTWRKKLRRQNIPDGGAVVQNNRPAVAVAAAAAVAVDNGCGGRVSNSTYVKVKMEGMAIARKIDISVHHSFETLTSNLMRMFGISEENWNSFKLTYQDREGDWLIAEDVPWRTFIRSLKCIKLIRSRA